MARHPILPLCSLVLWIAALPGGLAADVVNLNPVKDNTLYENAGTVSNGAGAYFFAGRTNQLSGISIRRALLAFDVAGSIPPGSTIQSAVLTMNMSKTLAGNVTVNLHKVSADWGEGTSDAGGNEGAGDSATSGDATWTARFFGSANWTSAGGDFSGTASATQTVGGIGPYSWGSTAGMVADVQEWLDTPTANFGWMVRGSETTAGTAKRFDSRENTDVGGAKPVLEVTFTPPSAAQSYWMLY